MLPITDRFLKRFAIFNSVLLLICLYWYYQQQKPIELANVQLTSGKFSCVSYSPYYHPSVSPLQLETTISKAQIDADLALLSKHTECVRIYSVGQGLDYVPEAAAKHGLKVLLGVWIGWIPAQNEREFKLGIQLANRYPETVKGLIIGNEVLLRGEQSEAVLKSFIARARKATKVPLSYADVWEFWLKHRSLATAVDFVTVHILPYWEDQPIPIDQAVAHTQNVMQKLQSSFEKPILIGETGWPSMGRQRQQSAPGLINQARYVREFLNAAQSSGWNYNLIEAFDQPWKRKLEGTVGGYWGLYSTDLEPKFSLDQAVAERQDGLLPIYFLIIGATLALLSSGVQRLRVLSGYWAASMAGSLVGLYFYFSGVYLLHACRNPSEWLALGGIFLVSLFICGSQIQLLIRPRDEALNLIRTGQVLLLLGGAIAGLLILFDGRYRDFPLMLFSLPVLQLSIGMKALGLHFRPRWQIINILSMLTLLSAILCWGMETNNKTAALWFFLMFVLTRATRYARQKSAEKI